MRTEDSNAQGRQVIVIGDPAVNAGVAEVVSVPPGETATNYGLVMRLAGSARVVQATGGTFAVYFSPATPAVRYGSGTFLVAFDRANPSVSIGGASSSIGIYFDRGNPAVNLVSGTLTGITNSIAVHLLSTGGTLTIRSGPGYGIQNIVSTVAIYFDRANPAVSANYGSGTFLVAFDRANPSVSIGGAS